MYTGCLATSGYSETNGQMPWRGKAWKVTTPCPPACSYQPVEHAYVSLQSLNGRQPGSQGRPARQRVKCSLNLRRRYSTCTPLSAVRGAPCLRRCSRARLHWSLPGHNRTLARGNPRRQSTPRPCLLLVRGIQAGRTTRSLALPTLRRASVQRPRSIP